MTTRTQKALEIAMNHHAVWCHTGKVQAPKSLMARLMENQGVFNFGSGAGPKGPTNSIEERIESAMMKLASDDLMSADTIRLTFGAGALNVCKRRKLRIKWQEATQAQKAEALGISERTFRNKMQAGLSFILREVTK